MASTVASRYARALADAVLAAGSGLNGEQARDQVGEFAALVAESHDLKNVLMSPAVASSRKRALIGRLGERLGLHRLVRNFLCVLVDHRRIEAMHDILEALEAEMDARLGVVRADVTSAAPLDQDRQRALAERLAHLTGKQVRCLFSVDPGLIGGVVARIGSTIYDGSVRGQLDSLGAQLAG